MNLLSYLALAAAIMAGGLALSLSRQIGRTKRFRVLVLGAGCLLFLFNGILVFLFGLDEHAPVFLAIVGLLAPFILLALRLIPRLSTPLEVLELQLREAVPEALWILNKEGEVVGTNSLAEAYSFGQDTKSTAPQNPLIQSGPFRQSWELASLRPCDPQEGTQILSGNPLNWKFSPAYDRFGDFLGGSVTVSGLEAFQNSSVVLSEREQEVAKLIADGLDNLQIAERLFISQGTVKNHIHKILAKTGKNTRSQLVASSRVKGP